jgi:two-component system response regulator CpxR
MIDDDILFCELLQDYLKPEGHEITLVHDGREGLQKAMEGALLYDLILLDMMLPSMNGIDILQHIRLRIDTPVFMLTSCHDEVKRIEGLEMGADDYMTKPFNSREFMARIRTILRRPKAGGTRAQSLPASERIVLGDIELDTGSRVVRRGGEHLHLTSIEFNFLEMLLRAAGHVVAREELAKKILGRSLAAYDRSVDVHLSSLRRKLGHEFGGTERIKSVRGVGYIYAAPPQTAEKRTMFHV